MDDLAGVQVAARVDAFEQRPLDENARRGDVLIHPGRVFLTDPVVVRDRAAAIHERLLDGSFDGVVGVHGAVGIVGYGEGEVLAGARVVGVRQVTEHRSPDPPLLDGLQGGGDGSGVDLDGVAPRRGGLGDVADHAVVQHEIADVGGVVLLLVVEGARPLADPQPAVGAHDLADEPFLVGDVVRGPLETDEGHGDLLQVPALGQHDLLDALAEQRRQLRGAFPVGHDVLRLDGVRDTGHHDGGVGGDDLLARLQPVLVGGEEVGLDFPHLGDAVHVHPRGGDDPEAPLRTQHHLAHARAGGCRRQRP